MDQAGIAVALAKVDAARKVGDLVALKKALQEAKEAGAPIELINQAFREIHDIESAIQNDTPISTPDSADESPEVAEARQWKDQGNAKLKEGQKASLHEALKCYTYGLNVSGLKHNTLMAQLYGNRAHVHTLIQNFVNAVDDCRKALDLDSSNAKNYWRAARASMLNELFQQAVDFCDLGLEAHPKNADLMKMKDQCAAKLSKRQASRKANPQEAMETQDRVNQLREQTVSCAMQIQSKEMRKRQSTLTLEEMNALPTDARTFAACGRAFLLTPQNAIKEKLRTAISSLDEELPKLTKAKEELDKRRMGAEKELQEIIETLR